MTQMAGENWNFRNKLGEREKKTPLLGAKHYLREGTQVGVPVPAAAHGSLRIRVAGGTFHCGLHIYFATANDVQRAFLFVYRCLLLVRGRAPLPLLSSV